MFSIYDDLIKGIDPSIVVKNIYQGDVWTMVETEENSAIAMTVDIDTIDDRIEFTQGMKLKTLAEYAKSWNLKMASVGMAAINAYYNDKRFFPNESDDAFIMYKEMIKGKNVAVIGHFMFVDKMFSDAKNLYIFEKQPCKGDYPDTAYEFILPICDYVFITGATFVNKSIVRILQIAKGKKIFMVGPSVPMSKRLFNYSITHLSGFVITRTQNIKDTIKGNSCRGVFKDGIMVSMIK